MHRYYLWPNGFYLHEDDVDENLGGRSDDYTLIYVPDWVDSTELDEWLEGAMVYVDTHGYGPRPGGVLIREELRSLADKLGELAAVTLDCPDLNSLLMWTEMAVRELSEGKRRGAEQSAYGAEERLNNSPTWIGTPVED